MQPLFTILLPTYQRPELVLRAIRSVQDQSHTDWHLIIIIDDISSDYSQLKEAVATDSRITLFQNDSNIGKNASLNRGLSHLEAESFDGYIVFLDDDDWLATECLSELAAALTATQSHWIVTNRTDSSTGRSLVVNHTGNNRIRYIPDMLISRRFKGETTHCINFQTTKRCRFPKTIKNAEEWLYFSAVAKYLPTFLYVQSRGTLTDGYSSNGLTHIRKNRAERLYVAKQIWQELFKQHATNPCLYAYAIYRSFKATL